MNEPFKSKSEIPEWLMIYNHVSKLGVHDVVTYEELSQTIGRDFHESRNPIYRAISELEKNDSRTLSNVRGRGYRVAAATEHEVMAKSHHKRSKRQMKKAISKASSADRSELNEEERTRLDRTESTLRNHAEMINRIDERTQKNEETLRSLRKENQTMRRESQTNVAELSEKVDNLEALLEKHGVKASQ